VTVLPEWVQLASDGFAAMCGAVVIAAVVRPGCAALRVARDRNFSGYWTSWIAQERPKYASGPVSFSGHDSICFFDAHVTGARHTLERAEGPLIFREIGAAW
jgi:hypothetical protein